MIYQGNARYPVKEVILHCAAINTRQFAHMNAFQVFSTVNQWHRERGFAGFGYHGLFMPDGEFYAGRPFTQIGAHCIERNRGSLGFLLIESKKIYCALGRTVEDYRFHDWFTGHQRAALMSKIAELDGIELVSGHNDYAQKLCPGFKVRSSDWLN